MAIKSDYIYDSVSTSEKMPSVSFTNIKTKFCLSLHYNFYLCVNGMQICKLKAVDRKCIQDFTNDEMIETSLRGPLYDVSTDYGLIGAGNVLCIYEHLMKKQNVN